MGILSFLQAAILPAASARGGYLEGEDQEADKQRAQARADAELALQQQREASQESRATLTSQLQDIWHRGNMRAQGIVPSSMLGANVNAPGVQKVGSVNGEDFYYSPDYDDAKRQRDATNAMRTAHAQYYRDRGTPLSPSEADDLEQSLIGAGHDPNEAHAAVIGATRGDWQAFNRILPPKAPPKTTDPAVAQRREITTLDTQIRDARGRASAFGKQADATTLPGMLDPSIAARAPALRDSSTKYTAKADSLTAKRDSIAGAMINGQPAPAGSTTAPSTAPTTPKAQPLPVALTGGKLTPEQQQAMQAEYDDASNDLNAVLNSNAPPAVKRQARQLYDQHQTAIAQKYGTTLPGGTP